ncbi:MAG: 50S ribosomal protein L30 [Methylacidiphilales bacterium]|nr:50S ribosomal protein L30 [Candidatus Methylacidiphilales bacterium]
MNSKISKKGNTITLTLIKSVAKFTVKQKQTIAGLGLRKFGSVSTLTKTPSVEGMIRSMRFALKVEEST